MAHPLYGARARLDRAVAQYNSIVAAIHDLPVEKRSVTFDSAYDSATNEIVITAIAVPEYPAHWALTISEALYNARVALDYLAWELARWNLQQAGEDREPHPSTQFPIATSATKFNVGQVKDLHPDHVEIIRAFQPYAEAAAASWPGDVDDENREIVASTTPLAKLNSVNNEAKHRILNPVLSSVWKAEMGRVENYDCELVSAAMFLQSELNAGVIWERYVVEPTGPNPRLEVHNAVTPDLTFGRLAFMKEFPQIAAAVCSLLDRFDSVLG